MQLQGLAIWDTGGTQVDRFFLKLLGEVEAE
jgi:hypothetical protein